ncbi:hypothetical protein B0J11DRAFT_423637 [Dendryphion nanum]|uniref:Uncharacterized protein n=1 Tax=Dendryphion nanum TaxID=256645 RepID=A0A9P9EKN7_9PLEO|nr:hypothetical protein B0J11DRAFT_423637 [Dendryphion nanum]
MSQDSSFRYCIALLLIVQAACWLLTVLDLFSPGKPLSLARNSISTVQNSTWLLRIMSRREDALVYSFADLRAR